MHSNAILQKHKESRGQKKKFVRAGVSFLMATKEGKEMTLKLLVDEKMKRVVFAEADKDFVDILFSFLTLPLGTIIRRLGKQSALGSSMDNLYESIESLDAAKHLQTEACKAMLLRPLSAAAYRCEDLKFNVDDAKPRKVFHCKNSECCAKSICFGSPVENTRCPHCKLLMDKTKGWTRWDEESVGDGDGVFVNGGVTFMISDDLQVMPASLANNLSLIQKLGIEDGATLEEKTMVFGTEEVSIVSITA